MYRWLVRTLINRAYKRLRAGDPRPALALAADDIEFVFPGENSWARHTHSKAELQDWVARFVKLGLQVHPRDILVRGWPWNTRVAIYFDDHLKDANGKVVYENQGVIYGRTRWGKMKYYEVTEDTEKTAALDRYLAKHEPAIA